MKDDCKIGCPYADNRFGISVCIPLSRNRKDECPCRHCLVKMMCKKECENRSTVAKTINDTGSRIYLGGF